MGFFILPFLILSLQLEPSFSEHPKSELFESLLTKLLETKFSHLKSKNILIRKFKNEDRYFFYTFVENVFNPFKKRDYIICINEKIMNSHPEPTALHAILAHELQHLSDYSQMSALDLVWLALQYEVFEDKKYIKNFERQTDRAIIKKGFQHGLILYRKWLYQNIPSDEIHRKKQNYYTPEEILAADSLDPNN